MGAAQAQSTQTAPRTYIGVGVANVDHDYSSAGGLNITDKDGYNANAKIFGGYEFDQNWGAEIGYTDFRNSDFSYNVAGVNGRGTSDGHAYYAAAKYQYPLNDQFAVYGKLGVERTQSRLKDVGVYSQSQGDTGAYASVGLQYNFTPKVAVVAEYERYGKEKDFGAKPDVWTIGARYNF
jgi:OOP family OmpA-OmpF porin